MPVLTIVDRTGAARTVEGETGLSVMEIIRDNGYDELLAMCGGCCSCATCHVYVGEPCADRLPLIGDAENELLNGSCHRTSASRLSCQIKFDATLDGLRVVIAPE